MLRPRFAFWDSCVGPGALLFCVKRSKKQKKEMETAKIAETIPLVRNGGIVDAIGVSSASSNKTRRSLKQA